MPIGGEELDQMAAGDEHTLAEAISFVDDIYSSIAATWARAGGTKVPLSRPPRVVPTSEDRTTEGAMTIPATAAPRGDADPAPAPGETDALTPGETDAAAPDAASAPGEEDAAPEPSAAGDAEKTAGAPNPRWLHTPERRSGNEGTSSRASRQTLLVALDAGLAHELQHWANHLGQDLGALLDEAAHRHLERLSGSEDTPPIRRFDA